MLSTVSMKLILTREASDRLELLRQEYAKACNMIVPEVIENRCWNRVALHKSVYSMLRAATKLGSQMTCNAIFSVCKAYQAQSRRLQSNGTQSAKKRLRKVSGREARHVEHINHQISKSIIEEVKNAGASMIALEDLTHIRDNIRGGERIRSRLHRWPFRQLQGFIVYKAEALGISVCFVNPAYTSITCAGCLSMGGREKHQFKCSNCGLLAHADCNANRNLARIVGSADSARARVNGPNVGTLCAL